MAQHSHSALSLLPHHDKELPSSGESAVLEKLDSLIQWQTQNAAQWEEIKKTQEEYQKRQQLQMENLDRRLKILEEALGGRKLGLRDETSKEDKRPRVLTKEQNKFKQSICEEYKGTLPSMEVRKALSKRLYDQYKDDPQLCIQAEVCETQVNNWFYDQMRNKARNQGPGKKRGGRKRKSDSQGWTADGSPSSAELSIEPKAMRGEDDAADSAAISGVQGVHLGAHSTVLAQLAKDVSNGGHPVNVAPHQHQHPHPGPHHAGHHPAHQHHQVAVQPGVNSVDDNDAEQPISDPHAAFAFPE